MPIKRKGINVALMRYANYIAGPDKLIFVEVEKQVLDNEEEARALLDEIIATSLKGTMARVHLLNMEGEPRFFPKEDVPENAKDKLDKLYWGDLPD